MSLSSWADEARDGGVYMAVFIGGSRDASRQKARKPLPPPKKKVRKGCVRAALREEERACRPLAVFTVCAY